MIEIGFKPTLRCDRGCSHCYASSTISGESMSPSKAFQFLEELNQLDGEKRITITGGGEPLLWPWLPDFVWELLQDKRNHVHVVTSGCMSEYERGYQAFRYLTAIRAYMLKFAFSYTPYNPSSKERLLFSLPYLMEVNGRITIKLTMSYQDSSATEELYALLTEEGFERFMLYPPRSNINKWYEDLRYKEFVLEDADFSEQIYLRPYPDEESREQAFFKTQIIEVRPQSLSLVGRGENLYKGSDWNEASNFTWIRPDCYCLRNLEEPALDVGPDCVLYPCSCNLPASQSKHIALGTLGEISLEEALKKQQEVLKRLRTLSLHPLPSGMLEANPCEYCQIR